MKNDIIEKLKKVSNLNEYSEQDVLYYIVESCKLLEQSDQLKHFKILNFYRNWCCHSYISKDTQIIFNEIYDLIKNMQNSINFAQKLDEMVNRKFSEYSFIMLGKDIEKFAKRYLDGVLPKLNFFQEPLQKIIIDTPLAITNNGRKNGDELFKIVVYHQGGKFPFDTISMKIGLKTGHQIMGGSRELLFKF